MSTLYIVIRFFPDLVNDKWDHEELIILRPQGAAGATVSYALNFDFSSGIIPGAGDTLYIVTYNPIENDDVYHFTADDSYIVSVEDNMFTPEEFRLYQNYPNPFNPSTTIKYEIPDQVRNDNVLVKLKIYDILGRKVATLVNKEQSAGGYEVQFDASHLTSGVYIYRLQSGSFVESRKMVLLK